MFADYRISPVYRLRPTKSRGLVICFQNHQSTGVFRILVWELGAVVVSSRSGATFQEWDVQYCERHEQKNFLV